MRGNNRTPEEQPFLQQLDILADSSEVWRGFQFIRSRWHATSGSSNPQRIIKTSGAVGKATCQPQIRMDWKLIILPEISF